MNIGENIKKYRKIKKLSQQDLSKLSGIPRISISRYENGDRVPNIDIIKKITTALDVSLEAFIYQANLPKYEYNNLIGFNESESTYIHPTITIDNFQQFKPNEVSNINARDSLINLLLNTTNDSEVVNNLTTKELDALLSKVTDLIEFELYKLSKSID